MEIKWFFVIWGFIFVALLASVLYFVASNISTQSFKQYEDAQIRADERYNNSTMIHNKQTDNITNEISHLNNRLDPILDQIPNATQSKIDQDLHYRNALIHFNELNIMNQTINKILDILNKSSSIGINGTIIEVPIPIVINNGSTVTIENKTN